MIKERDNVSIRDIPNILGITYNRPNAADFDPAVVPEGFAFSSRSYPVQLFETAKKKYDVWDGRLFQDIPIQELMPQFKLITDFFGVYTYSSDPIAVINKYIHIMRQEGILGIVYNNKDFVKTEKGVMIFHEWLESVSGDSLSIEYGNGRLRNPGAEKTDGEVAYMLIRKSSEDQVQLPNLTMVDYQNAQRTFRPSADIIDAY